MLTDEQKQGIRLLIKANPSPEYMAQLAEDDEYALAQLAENLPEIRRQTANLMVADREQV